jgi:phytanoyl-CoA hydroxylase
MVVPRFTLGPSLDATQRAFFEEHGFLVFGGVAAPAEVEALRGAVTDLQGRWVAEGRTAVHGIPFFRGRDPDGHPFLGRMCFTSCFAPVIRDFVLDARFEPVRRLAGEDARVGHDEKDGVVVNQYLNVPGSAYPKLGWHTDGLRDLFYLRMPQRMLNVGLHLDRITRADGGLRLLPGTHRQGFFSMCFRKPYFVSHAEDPAEVCVETEPGDLTVHDGRLWHRVAPSPHVGWRSLRRSMYVPYQTGPHERKSDASPTPFYHRVGGWLRRLRGAA